MTISLVRIKSILNPGAYRDFKKFLSGQTVELMPRGETGVFEDDFIRWVKRLPVVD